MICAMVLAAGRSSRMGRQKLLLPLGGTLAIVRIVDEVSHAQIDRIFVVVRPGENDVVKAIEHPGIEFVVNPDPQGDMLSSVRCGLRAMPGDCAVLAVLGDQPGITRLAIDLVVRDYQASGRGIVVPTFNGRRGHPLIFHIRYRDEILTRFDDQGLCGLLHAHPEDVFEVDLHIPDIIEDMDLPEDYQKMSAKFQSPDSTS